MTNCMQVTKRIQAVVSVQPHKRALVPPGLLLVLAQPLERLG